MMIAAAAAATFLGQRTTFFAGPGKKRNMHMLRHAIAGVFREIAFYNTKRTFSITRGTKKISSSRRMQRYANRLLLCHRSLFLSKRSCASSFIESAENWSESGPPDRRAGPIL